MNPIRTAALAIGLTAAVAGTVTLAQSATADSATARSESGSTLWLTSQLDTLQPVDVAPAGPSVGDSFYVGSHIVSGGRGHIGAACTTVTASDAGIKQCEVDFLLAHGSITTRGLTDTAGTTVQLVVTGGTGRYADAGGQGTLTPTPTGSKVILRLT